MTSRKEVMNEVFDAGLVTVGTVGVSMLSRKLLKEKLSDATRPSDIFRLFLGIALSTVAVKYAQDKKWIPDNPFKT